MCARVCAFDKVHDEYMHECVTVVIPAYAKQEKMHQEHVCWSMCVAAQELAYLCKCVQQ